MKVPPVWTEFSGLHDYTARVSATSLADAVPDVSSKPMVAMGSRPSRRSSVQGPGTLELDTRAPQGDVTARSAAMDFTGCAQPPRSAWQILSVIPPRSATLMRRHNAAHRHHCPPGASPSELAGAPLLQHLR